ncbi:hypothetical protein Fcan01_22883 [Folsomia candida]|uniref:Uncharacterized protein n=1 Tax=Folsomia candida TaxID=158441 RepID=A0A226DCD3_FOLCA|nr:hypothetical protein Fcan01_22883 [Folsomia candida]
MVAILFTNSYNSGIISTLNAPLPQVRIENWNYVIQDCHRAEIGGLTNISILNWMNNMGISKYWGDVTEIELMISDKLENPFESENCFRLLSPSGQRNRRFFDLYPPSYDRPANKFFNYEDNVHTQSLIETGIWRRLEEEKQARDLGLRPKVPKVEAEGSDPVKMDGSILTLFIMWSIVLSLTAPEIE